ncbi:MAG: precorrin-8X methylmutase [Candidatus Scalindua sp. AMX11]|nr:MAG: precorrin-8X methylmutase [Candidatus Scalindua sp.]NOG86086.1 precorrin-8X methylmutase [Planctomycetota bacterium]RZV98853.1 MAG: precorrin-8X methylmutase [Candidatus Scalindua sp. SCAELEC01]TDE66955.1 MAG: precorrin-8X methylmutase [Candidatus Scalindua sp. AMX11]GJQ57763.1 MAG: precorrin-8X methylmutase [Candidatus Scalindua sp.]
MKNHKQAKDYFESPQDSIDESFLIIENLVDFEEIPKMSRQIVRRVIHATGDTDYAHSLVIHPKAVESGIEAIMSGKSVVTDVNMVRAGINKKGISHFGGKIICKIADGDVAQKVNESNKTRAVTAMQESLDEMSGGIVAIGNAPTAVFSLIDLIRRESLVPALIVAVPVGFVKASESKEALMVYLDSKKDYEIPYIVNIGRKGGSVVAVSIINALLQMVKSGEV